jgi:molecular chaperone GrpE
MNDLPPSDDDGLPLIEAVAEPEADAPADVELVVPAAAYDSVATHDEFVPRIEPEPEPESEPTPAPGPDWVEAPAVLEVIRELGETLGRRLDGLQTLFDREIRAEATREKVVDRLHAELQEYKQDLLLNTLRPMFVDLIQLHDDIGKLLDAQAESDGEIGRMRQMMRNLQQGIEDILYRQGVEPYTAESHTFDPRRQRAVSTVATDDPGLAKTVAARLRKGFQAGEKVIRPEIVSVYSARK